MGVFLSRNRSIHGLISITLRHSHDDLLACRHLNAPWYDALYNTALADDASGERYQQDSASKQTSWARILSQLADRPHPCFTSRHVTGGSPSVDRPCCGGDVQAADAKQARAISEHEHITSHMRKELTTVVCAYMCSRQPITTKTSSPSRTRAHARASPRPNRGLHPPPRHDWTVTKDIHRALTCHVPPQHTHTHITTITRTRACRRRSRACCGGTRTWTPCSSAPTTACPSSAVSGAAQKLTYTVQQHCLGGVVVLHRILMYGFVHFHTAIREEGGGVSSGTADAAPTSGSSSTSSSSSLPIESLETKAAALFSIAADQARKMQAQAQHGQQGQGNGDSGCHAIVALYQVSGRSDVSLLLHPLHISSTPNPHSKLPTGLHTRAYQPGPASPDLRQPGAPPALRLGRLHRRHCGEQADQRGHDPGLPAPVRCSIGPAETGKCA